MVYNVLGTAALVSGTALEVFQSSKRTCVRATAGAAGGSGGTAGAAGHLLHAPRLDVQGSAWGDAGDGDGDSDDDDQTRHSHNLKGLLKDNRFVQRARNEDFFYSLVHSTAHTRKMLGDIMQKLKNQYTDMARERGDIFQGTVGEFLFEYMTFAVTLLAVIDSIQILKQNTDRHKASKDRDVTAAHPLGWTSSTHYLHCQFYNKQRSRKNADLFKCGKSGVHVDARGKVLKCPCCRALEDDNTNTSVKCPICEPVAKHNTGLIQPEHVFADAEPNPYDKLVYPDTAVDTPSTVLAISGHLASMLALHAFLHNDILRPGNAAPVYNVHLTMQYEETLCRGLLLRNLDQDARDKLSPIIGMMTYHELWINVDADEVDVVRIKPFVQCASTGAALLRRPLFHTQTLKWHIDNAHDASPVHKGDCIVNSALGADLSDQYERMHALWGGGGDGGMYRMDTHKLFAAGVYWPCVDDYIVTVINGRRTLFVLKESENHDAHNMFLLVPRTVPLYIRPGDDSETQDGYDTDDDDHNRECGHAHFQDHSDRTDISEFTTLVLRQNATHSKLFYRSYRWRALPTGV